ncbi:archaea-specific SMC-related protein [Natronomonas amylolytica]|uniref:archaea-specific SMC-related protein n=1 Tax=Natronomonas amylolytica TaxID=3108498 RepID=UPI00300A337D
MSVEQVDVEATLDVQNIGGIDETSVVFEPGVTVLAGRNATNRTSLLQAVMAALGSDNVSVKADADEAHVELELDGETYSRTLESTNGRIRADGEPYLEDPTLGDLFAFLLESNEARRAVVTDADLRDIIMRPVDTDEIQAEIDRLVEKRREIADELDELDDLKNRLPSLEEKKTGLEERIDEKKAELEEVEAEIEAADADVEEGREEQAELEEKLEELRDKRSDLEDVRYELETEQDSLESLRAEKREVEAEYDELPETPAGDLDELESRIDRLRTQKQELESDLNELQSVIGFNQEMLEADTTEPLAALDDAGDGPVTDELLADETVTCWTCGSEVESDQIERTVEQLQERSQEIVGEINDIESELDEAKSTRRERQDQQRQRERLERRRHDLEDDIEDTEARIETLTERRESMQEDIEDIEAEVEALESDAYEEILDQHKEANQLEYDLGTLENDLERVEDNIATIEDRLDEESDLEAEREDVNEEIQDLRTRIERIEQEAIEAFNEHMETVLNLLEYENLARVWLERTETEVREGRRKVTKSVFELHIVRQTASGATYEDVVENLSESEREVTGLIFALAGYLAHDVYETVPFMLLDSLEAIDSNRIATLIDHLAEYSDFLVVALLPEDASALDDDYRRIEEI